MSNKDIRRIPRPKTKERNLKISVESIRRGERLLRTDLKENERLMRCSIERASKLFVD